MSTLAKWMSTLACACCGWGCWQQGCWRECPPTQPSMKTRIILRSSRGAALSGTTKLLEHRHVARIETTQLVGGQNEPVQSCKSHMCSQISEKCSVLYIAFWSLFLFNLGLKLLDGCQAWAWLGPLGPKHCDRNIDVINDNVGIATKQQRPIADRIT